MTQQKEHLNQKLIMPNNKENLKAENLFGSPSKENNNTETENAFEEAILLNGLGVSVDPEIAEELGASSVSIEHFEEQD